MRSIPLLIFLALSLCLVTISSFGQTPKEKTPEVQQTVKKNTVTGAEMIWIPAGLFRMGDPTVDENPPRDVYLSGYWIGKTLVTVAEFRAYCKATSYPFRWNNFPPPWGWIDDHPMVNVTWAEAVAYCKWAGGDLPTEAQWEKAARGKYGRTFPWGYQWDPSRLECSLGGPGRVGKTAPVTAHPTGASPYGCLDMAGNVTQWCVDWVGDNKTLPDKDPVRLKREASLCKVIRGGSLFSTETFHCAYRLIVTPESSGWKLGFRVACVQCP